MSRDIYPQYSNTRINNAGKKVRDGVECLDDLVIIENWRASHNHVLNTWQASLRNRIRSKDVVFAQRLKRRITIFDKLRREPTMALSNMHDVAGCRLIFPNIQKLEDFRRNIHEKNRFKHKLYRDGDDPYNYILNPRASGYRSIHDVYIYKSQHKGGKPWDGLKVEIQYRTSKQHSWATAVEIAGALTGNHSKFGQGSEEQKEFFRLSSELIARAHEGLHSCYPDLSNANLISDLKELDGQLRLLRYLETLQIISVKVPKKRKALILMSRQQEGKFKITIRSFDSMPQATRVYFELEKTILESDDLVLVRSDTNEGIKNAFKNYFSDAGDFVRLVRSGVEILS
ncbi:MAG: (p)ppGpp synthetase [Alphaproteobacteria bacterium]|nr:(p)ppGpp synthetase [Alphaproteobacteria bacterium]